MPPANSPMRASRERPCRCPSHSAASRPRSPCRPLNSAQLSLPALSVPVPFLPLPVNPVHPVNCLGSPLRPPFPSDAKKRKPAASVRLLRTSPFGLRTSDFGPRTSSTPSRLRRPICHRSSGFVTAVSPALSPFAPQKTPDFIDLSPCHRSNTPSHTSPLARLSRPSGHPVNSRRRIRLRDGLMTFGGFLPRLEPRYPHQTASLGPLPRFPRFPAPSLPAPHLFPPAVQTCSAPARPIAPI